MTQPHVDPLTITPVKEKHDGKSDKYVLKLELHKDPTLPTPDPNEIKNVFAW